MFSTEWFQTVIKGFFNLQMDLKHSLSVQNDFITSFKIFYHVKIHSADLTPPFFHPGLHIYPTAYGFCWNDPTGKDIDCLSEVLTFTHTPCTPRNETQRWCSMCVNIDCVSSGLYCALPHLGLVSLMFLIQYGSCRFCYIVQYAVHKSFALRNILLNFFWLFHWYTFFSIKPY